MKLFYCHHTHYPIKTLKSRSETGGEAGRGNSRRQATGRGEGRGEGRGGAEAAG